MERLLGKSTWTLCLSDICYLQWSSVCTAVLREKNEKNKLLFGNAYFYSWIFSKGHSYMPCG